jgi:hypothetical protein
MLPGFLEATSPVHANRGWPGNSEKGVLREADGISDKQAEETAALCVDNPEH